MIELLTKFCELGKLVSVYMDSQNTTNFIFGRIICINNDNIAINMISPTGYYDGILVKSTEEIIRLEIDDEYGQKIKKLYQQNDCKDNAIILNNKDIIGSMLNIAKQSKKIISCELINSEKNDIVGFVEDVVNGICTIKQVNSYGYDDGFSYIMVDDISQITYDSSDEQSLLKLWNINYAP